MTHSYIISGETLVARVPARTSGEVVRYSSDSCEEAIDAARDKNLVNAQTGKISNAKSWDAVYRKQHESASATEINPGEFLLS